MNSDFKAIFLHFLSIGTVGSRFDLVCRSYKSVTRDLCRKQICEDRQIKLYKTHHYIFPGKL